MKVEKLKYPYYIDIDTVNYPRAIRGEMWKWCKDTFKEDVWSWDNSDEFLGTYKFTKLKYAQWFLLRWGNEV